MRIKSLGHAAYAAAMIFLGILGLIKGNFAPGWAPVPKSAPAQSVLVYLTAFISLLCGIGLLFQRTAAIASRLLFVYLLLWLLLFRVPYLFPLSVGSTWSCGCTAVMLAAAWVLYIWFAGDQDKQRFKFATGDSGLRIARTLFGLGLIPFGMAHFLYLKETVVLIQSWPAPVAWAYFTGGAFIAAGIAIVIGVFAQLAALLTALQIALFTLIIWVPRAAVRNLSAFQWGEFIVSCVLAAAACVVADSYRGTPWLAIGKR